MWQKAPVQVGAVTATPRKDWNGGRSFSVQATLTNQGAAPVTLSSLMAIVWFGGDGDWTHPDAVRFLTRVTAVDGESTVASGRTVTVHCSLIGPASLDVTRTAVHLMLIWQ
ncbi:hypothetical protein GCM10025857_09230 [Alicyclobacillus contaminans]|nr:hypothetical protein GCM10025857_09230 [Alicyclobacillus contaminans]